MSEFCFNPGSECVELLPHQLVVVVAPRIAGHGSAGGRTAVVETNHDRADRSFKWKTCITPLFRAAGQVIHVSGVAFCEPGLERRSRFSRAERRDADKIETHAVSLRLDPALDSRIRCRSPHRSFTDHCA